jgi:phage tail protein X
MNTQYITQDGDRWDTIAHKAWGDCTKTQIQDLKDANPYETTKDVFAANVKINVPIRDESVTENIDTLLPPWKRPATELVIKQSEEAAFDSSFDESFG